MDKYPILYSFRRCPYAMRARMAIYQADIKCEYREVLLKDKPESMMSLSSKGTVPVLLTSEDSIIDQSLEVMLWALHQSDSENWLGEDRALGQVLVERNDDEFKYYLDRYKYYVGYPEHPQAYYRDKAGGYLDLLEECLRKNKGASLTGDRMTFSDASIFPFIRQFANVDIDWFKSSPYALLNYWYNNIEQGDLFKGCMDKYKQWTPDQQAVYFPQ